MQNFHGDFDSVLFDCDSTLTKIEGIDELAALKNVKDEVSRITNDAMEGRLSFQSALERRLSIIRPSHAELLAVGQKYIDEVVDGAVELINTLRLSGKQIYILSGGFLDSVSLFAEFLGVDSKFVFANEIFFEADGNYSGFNGESALARSHGKAEIVRTIKGSKVMIGDGASDLETRNDVDLFIGYCGVQKRKIIEENADIVVYDSNLMSVAPLIMNRNFSLTESDQIRFNNIDLRR